MPLRRILVVAIALGALGLPAVTPATAAPVDTPLGCMDPETGEPPFFECAPGEPPAADHVVEVGWFDEAHPTYEHTAFYPNRLEVHQGDTVRFDSYGFHTVAFLPGNVHTSLLRTDEVPHTYAVDEQTFFPPAGQACGSGEEPCVLAGTDNVVNSGAEFSNWVLQADAEPGTYRLHCNIHPTMHMDLVVKSVGQTLSNQSAAQIETAKAAAVTAADAAVVAANATPAVDLGGGRQRHQVYAGVGTDTMNVYGYFPQTVDAKPGDEVRFVMGADLHTVTFPVQAVGNHDLPLPFAAGLSGVGLFPACDLDDPRSGLPGVPGFICPGNFELRFAPFMVERNRAYADEVLTPATYHDSAFMVPEKLSSGSTMPAWLRTGPNGETMPSTFDAKLPAEGQFGYSCNLHGTFMTGAINVSAA